MTTTDSLRQLLNSEKECYDGFRLIVYLSNSLNLSKGLERASS